MFAFIRLFIFRIGLGEKIQFHIQCFNGRGQAKHGKAVTHLTNRATGKQIKIINIQLTPNLQ